MKKGFTLIEILIVVAIIAVLASVVIIGLGQTGRTGRDARRIADLRQVQTALELYFNRCGRYPGGLAPAGGGACPAGTPSSWNALRATLSGSQIGVASVPSDPQSPTRSYGYFTNTNGTTYVLSAALEDPNNQALRSSLTQAEFNALGVPVGFDATPSGNCGQQTPPAQSLYCISL